MSLSFASPVPKLSPLLNLLSNMSDTPKASLEIILTLPKFHLGSWTPLCPLQWRECMYIFIALLPLADKKSTTPHQEHYALLIYKFLHVPKCNIGYVKCKTRLLASSLLQSEYGVAGGFMQGQLDFTARLRVSNHSVFFAIGLFSLSFSRSPPILLWLHGKYVVSIPCFKCVSSVTMPGGCRSGPLKKKHDLDEL